MSVERGVESAVDAFFEGRNLDATGRVRAELALALARSVDAAGLIDKASAITAGATAAKALAALLDGFAASDESFDELAARVLVGDGV